MIDSSNNITITSGANTTTVHFFCSPRASRTLVLVQRENSSIRNLRHVHPSLAGCPFIISRMSHLFAWMLCVRKNMFSTIFPFSTIHLYFRGGESRAPLQRRRAMPRRSQHYLQRARRWLGSLKRYSSKRGKIPIQDSICVASLLTRIHLRLYRRESSKRDTGTSTDRQSSPQRLVSSLLIVPTGRCVAAILYSAPPPGKGIGFSSDGGGTIQSVLECG